MLSQVSQSQDPSLPPPAKTRRVDLEWPAFHNSGITYPTEFVAGSWKCPLCCHTTPRIQHHLSSHKDIIENWESAEIFCKEMTTLKRKETKRKADRKREPVRSKDPKRKEVLRKADSKREPQRAEKPERKEVLRKADRKRMPERAENPDS